MEPHLSRPSARVIRTLEQVIEWRGKLAALRSESGPRVDLGRVNHQMGIEAEKTCFMFNPISQLRMLISNGLTEQFVKNAPGLEQRKTDYGYRWDSPSI
jgi:hypothetical protein